MGRVSEIRKFTKEELQYFYNTSSTQVEVLEKCGLDPSSGTHRTLKRVALELEVDLADFERRRALYIKTKLSKNRREVDISALCENSTVNRRSIKRLVIKHKLLDYSCDKCSNSGMWRGDILSLQLEHKNGINNDNRLENLCFLCPNCHSQTATYAGKNNKNGAR